MADPVTMSIASVVLVSLVSFVGVLAIAVKDVMLKKILLYFVAFSAGALLGDAFIHLLPEAVAEASFTAEISLYVLLGILVAFAVEKVIHWQHCHIPASKSHAHPFAYMNLFGDAVHNFIDGLIIAASYLASVPVGIATTIAVIFHEIPQEIGDFGVLIHGGFGKRRALALNFLSAVFAIIGAGAAILLSSYFLDSVVFLTAFAVGGFVYIAGADLIPELHKNFSVGSSVLQLAAIVLGIAVMYSLLLLE